jgi:hypothetical protein
MDPEGYDEDKTLSQWNQILRDQGFILKEGKASVSVHKASGEFIFRCRNLRKAIFALATHFEVDLTC